MSEKILAKTIGKSIVHQRKRLNLSQKELAGKLGIASESLGRIERGVISPKMERLQDIATALDCSVSALFQTSSKETQERLAVILDSIENFSPEQQEATIAAFSSVIDAVKAKKPM